MIYAILIFVLFQCALAVSSPLKFVLLSVWVQTIPYTWNWDTQVIYDTPIGPLNIVAIQMFGFCIASALALLVSLQGAVKYSISLLLHVLFICFALLSLTYTESPVYGLRMIVKLMAPLLFMATVLAVVSTKAELKALRSAIIGSGIVLMVLSVYAKLMGLDADPNAVDTGVSGLGPPSMGPPVFSAHMLPVAMLAFALFLRHRRFPMLCMTLASGVAIICALQRTSAAALFIGSALILFWGSKGFWRLLLPVGGILGLPLLLIVNDTFRRRMFYGDTSTAQILADPLSVLAGLNSSGRFAMWDSMLQRYYEGHRLLGSGVGSTQAYFYTHGGSGVIHSEYVRLLCEVGLAGLGLFVLAMAGYAWTLRNCVKQSLGDPDGAAASLAAGGALACYLVFASTDNAFDYVTQFGIYVFCMVAMAIKARSLVVSPRMIKVWPEQPPGVQFPNLIR